MSVREIQGHLLELYGLQVSPDLISSVTDEVLAELEQWQQRPLEAMYPIVYFDALQLKIRDEGTVKNKAVYPAAQIQTCIVHLIRNSLKLASWKERQPLAAAIKPIYQAVTAEAAAAALDALAQRVGPQIPYRRGHVAAPMGTGHTLFRLSAPRCVESYIRTAYPPEVLPDAPVPDGRTIRLKLRGGNTRGIGSSCQLQTLIWPCATSKRTGRCHLSPGSKPPISSRSCSANDSLAPSAKIF
ncbi:Transposase [Mycetohabitans rhizoxinica HKI 454]|uniref:Mutator family transposase n=1 Tax=Mycetohabitans rhizoxinica (strain DSM 19002 / CIP 109453 / HKI 454) TaxID=882378 RepID=E5ANU6_MYCRK|nr:Transposase [Mycetohabitans rhizoxinica HKI 454]